MILQVIGIGKAVIINAVPQILKPFRAGHEVMNPAGLGELVRKTGMAAVMKQTAKADGFGQIVDGIELAQAEIHALTELAFTQIGIDHRPEHPAAHVHYANAVEEP